MSKSILKFEISESKKKQLIDKLLELRSLTEEIEVHKEGGSMVFRERDLSSEEIEKRMRSFPDRKDKFIALIRKG